MKLKERKRHAILKAAIKEFSDQGFAGARMNHIGDLAEVSSRTLYKHFNNKEALFDAIVKTQVERLEMPATKEYNPNISLRDQLIEALTVFINSMSAEDHLTLSRITHPEFMKNPSLGHRAFEDHAVADHVLVRLIGQAMEAGHLRKEDPLYAAKQVAFMLSGFFYWPVLLLGHEEKVPKKREEVISECADMFLSYYQL